MTVIVTVTRLTCDARHMLTCFDMSSKTVISISRSILVLTVVFATTIEGEKQ